MTQQTSLAERFGINEENLAQRRAFLQITEEDRQLLSSMQSWAQTVAPAVAHEFYDWQFEFPHTLSFFQGMAQKKGVSLTELRSVLENAQAGYFVSIFRGADSNWGVSHFENRLRIGWTHDQIDLPTKWFVGSFTQYEELTAKYLDESYEGDEETKERARRAIYRIFNYDMQAILDSYTLSVFRSIGVQVDQIEVSNQQDRTEKLGEIKRSISDMLHEIQASVRTLGTSAEGLTSVAAHMNETATSVASATEELSASIREISSNSAKASQVAQEGVVSTQKASDVVTKLGSSSEEIGHVIKLINSIAEQTNLLALNATIEAARAGNAGKGFAVVAGEVKALASQTSNATGEISDQIVGIQSDATNAVGSMGTVSSIINQVNEHEASVAAAVEEQSAAVNEISRNAQEASQGANQTMSAAEELTTLSARIEELISSFDLQD